MIKFEIAEIDNGFLVKGVFDWLEDSDGDFVNDFTLYAASLPDAFAMIATKCDFLMDDQISKAEQAEKTEDREEITDTLPF